MHVEAFKLNLIKKYVICVFQKKHAGSIDDLRRPVARARPMTLPNLRGGGGGGGGAVMSYA